MLTIIISTRPELVQNSLSTQELGQVSSRRQFLRALTASSCIAWFQLQDSISKYDNQASRTVSSQPNEVASLVTAPLDGVRPDERHSMGLSTTNYAKLIVLRWSGQGHFALCMAICEHSRSSWSVREYRTEALSSCCADHAMATLVTT